MSFINQRSDTSYNPLLLNILLLSYQKVQVKEAEK